MVWTRYFFCCCVDQSEKAYGIVVPELIGSSGVPCGFNGFSERELIQSGASLKQSTFSKMSSNRFDPFAAVSTAHPTVDVNGDVVMLGSECENELLSEPLSHESYDTVEGVFEDEQLADSFDQKSDDVVDDDQNDPFSEVVDMDFELASNGLNGYDSNESQGYSLVQDIELLSPDVGRFDFAWESSPETHVDDEEKPPCQIPALPSFLFLNDNQLRLGRSAYEVVGVGAARTTPAAAEQIFSASKDVPTLGSQGETEEVRGSFFEAAVVDNWDEPNQEQGRSTAVPAPAAWDAPLSALEDGEIPESRPAQPLYSDEDRQRAGREGAAAEPEQAAKPEHSSAVRAGYEEQHLSPSCVIGNIGEAAATNHKVSAEGSPAGPSTATQAGVAALPVRPAGSLTNSKGGDGYQPRREDQTGQARLGRERTAKLFATGGVKKASRNKPTGMAKGKIRAALQDCSRAVDGPGPFEASIGGLQVAGAVEAILGGAAAAVAACPSPVPLPRSRRAPRGKAGREAGSRAVEKAKRPKPSASRFCHVCTRSANAVNVATCRNLATGRCRKVICEKCANDYGWQDVLDVIANPPLGLAWTCVHCRQCCPPRAQCATYQRINEQRRLRAREKREESASVSSTVPVSTLVEAGGPSNAAPSETPGPSSLPVPAKDGDDEGTGGPQLDERLYKLILDACDESAWASTAEQPAAEPLLEQEQEQNVAPDVQELIDGFNRSDLSPE